jgi:uncharacterized protein DUF6457
MDWPERYCAALEARAGGPLGLTEDETEAVLDLARQVAHSTERRFAPLSTYVTGKYVARRVAEGLSPQAALEEAATVARELEA